MAKAYIISISRLNKIGVKLINYLIEELETLLNKFSPLKFDLNREFIFVSKPLRLFSVILDL